jgi:hypothetical protein
VVNVCGDGSMRKWLLVLLMVLVPLSASAYFRRGNFSGGTPALPTVSQVLPYGGSTIGGASVAITGTKFTTATAVNFGATPATSFVVNSDTSITATSPPNSAGTVDVTVVNPGGTSAVASTCTLTAGAALPTPCDHYAFADLNQTYVGGVTDPNGNVLGGTELRFLTFHTVANGNVLNATASITCSVVAGCPVLFNGVGFWHDSACYTTPSSQGPQINALLIPGGNWYLDKMLTAAPSTCSGGGFDVVNSMVDMNFGGASNVLVAFNIGAKAWARDDTTGLWTLTDFTGMNGISGGDQVRSSMSTTDNSGAGPVQYLIFGDDQIGPVAAVNSGTSFTVPSAPESFAQTIGGTKCTFTNTLTAPTNCTNLYSGCQAHPNGYPTTCLFQQLREMAMFECPSTDHANNNGKASFASIGWEVYKRIPVTTGGNDASYWVLWGTVPTALSTTSNENGYRGTSCVFVNGAYTIWAVVQKANQNIYQIDPNNSGVATIVNNTSFGFRTFGQNQWGNTDGGGPDLNAYNHISQVGTGVMYLGEGDAQHAKAGRPTWGGAGADVVSGFFFVTNGATPVMSLYPQAGQQQTDFYNAMTPKVACIGGACPATGSAVLGNGCVSPGPCVVMSATRDAIVSKFPSNLNFMYFGGTDGAACITNGTPGACTNNAWVMSVPDDYLGNPF